MATGSPDEVVFAVAGSTANPAELVGANDVYARAGVTTPSGTGQLGGFGLTVKSRFKRSNPPYERAWSPDGTNQAAPGSCAPIFVSWLGGRLLA